MRAYSIEEVVKAAAECGAQGIEWGTDFHIKTEEDARLAKKLCDGNGIGIRSLGTYYRVGSRDYAEWERLCRLAGITGAEYMRTWLGTKGSAETSEEEYAALVEESLRLAEIAEKYGAVIANECHHDTYNDTTESSLRYLRDTKGKIFTYYQSWYRDREGDFDKLERLYPYVRNVHVSFSELEGFQKSFTEDRSFIDDIVSALAAKDFGGYVFIEFASENSYDSLVADVIRLAGIIGNS